MKSYITFMFSRKVNSTQKPGLLAPITEGMNGKVASSSKYKDFIYTVTVEGDGSNVLTHLKNLHGLVEQDSIIHTTHGQ